MHTPTRLYAKEMYLMAARMVSEAVKTPEKQAGSRSPNPDFDNQASNTGLDRLLERMTQMDAAETYLKLMNVRFMPAKDFHDRISTFENQDAAHMVKSYSQARQEILKQKHLLFPSSKGRSRP
ncbi:MAG: hypothetical protein M1837_001152 [Sclerophora amabilis]|nr:MAG: hypothetical protein M1837_001152 [Sclerophora amabilis]